MLNSKKDFQRITMEWLNPLKGRYTKGDARLPLGSFNAKYSRDTAEMEGWARPLWAFASYLKGGGHDEELERVYRNGLINGTDPDHEGYWGIVSDGDQRICEMPSIAYALMLVPEYLWDPLTDQQKENVSRWLNQVNEHTVPENNWTFFPILVNLALKKLGMPYDEERIRTSQEKIETLYLGNGWYRDGQTNNVDYYVAFAFHFYGLMISAFEPENPYSERYRSRAEEFGPQFIYWFADSGEAIPYGRSLTYRFAQIAYFSACLFAGVHPLPLPVMKGIICRHMEYWLNCQIVDNGGVMTVGYCYNNLIMSENYNAPGSPYWCMKAMLLLGLPDNHEFWSVDGAPMPELDKIKVLKEANMVVRRTADDVTAAVSGIHSVRLSVLGHTVEKYAKFLYSTKFGFSVQKFNGLLSEMAPDSMLVFEVEGKYFIRFGAQRAEIVPHGVVSYWSPLDGIEVRTAITFTNFGHVRTHDITSKIECKAYDCGFAVPQYTPGYKEVVTDSAAEVFSDQAMCRVIGGPGLVIAAAPNTNLLHTNTRIPAVAYQIPVGKCILRTDVVTIPDAYQS